MKNKEKLVTGRLGKQATFMVKGDQATQNRAIGYFVTSFDSKKLVQNKNIEN